MVPISPNAIFRLALILNFFAVFLNLFRDKIGLKSVLITYIISILIAILGFYKLREEKKNKDI
ncbi:hypothetical protein LQ50_02395 [Halalkalibacter okhensis]|uniref:Uncharacterized protein n=1 Tax=Halalkalibacter okhensis TaxID=333138 RepID=A0A0B0IG55_9BACI|nr:hypothetical protein LQ50_02395 [Halalkalibacter okhensis]